VLPTLHRWRSHASSSSPVSERRVLPPAVRWLLVRVAICRQHRRRHPASLTHRQPRLASPGTDLRIAGRTHRSGSPSSPRLPFTGVADGRSGARPRARRPLPRPRHALLGRLARLLPALGNDQRDPIQGAENADRLLKGFTGIDGDLHNIPLRMAAMAAQLAQATGERPIALQEASHPCPEEEQSPRWWRNLRRQCSLRHSRICRIEDVWLLVPGRRPGGPAHEPAVAALHRSTHARPRQDGHSSRRDATGPLHSFAALRRTQ
jgi:hypothetical protein